MIKGMLYVESDGTLVLLTKSGHHVPVPHDSELRIDLGGKHITGTVKISHSPSGAPEEPYYLTCSDGSFCGLLDGMGASLIEKEATS